MTDPSGLGVAAAVEISSQSNQVQTTLQTAKDGTLEVPRLPFGVYQLTVERSGFATSTTTFEIRSSTPTAVSVPLKLASASATVTVSADATLINTAQAGAVNRIGSATVQTRLGSLPGRSLQDLIATQPGWVFEGSAVLHPRGSEYQTQFVIDGIPVQDNRSPSSGPELEADDVGSMSIYTAGIPAQYGRKMGGVVEINTLEQTREGFHGRAVLNGGGYATRGAFFDGEYTAGKNTFGFSADGAGTSHYLNPVVPQNFNNDGTTGDFSASFERRFSANDRLDLSLRNELSRFQLPNEQVQQTAGQSQNGDNYETMAIARYAHTFSATAVANLRGMWRRTSNDIWSNAASTPVMVNQHNFLTEGYANADLTFDRGHHEWSMGAETDNTFLHENFGYHITDDSDYDPDTPIDFSFAAHRPDLEQSVYVQDLMHYGRWTINAGLRWDHYQLIVNRQALSPRLSIARYFPALDMTAHFSYDRVFQTPSSANILLSSSAQVDSIAPDDFLRLPVEPSRGNYYEGGVSKALFRHFRLNVNYYRRAMNNFADDDEIDNTTIAFPIAFDKAVIYGAGAQLTLPTWGRFSGSVSYSYMVGSTWFPVTGGLFLGDNADSARLDLTGHFPNSQDQRNTLSGRLRYRLTPRVWVAGGLRYDSGLPFEFDGDYASALAQYGPAVLDRVNFDRGRIRPVTLVNLSLGANVYHTERYTVNLQVDGQNLTNELDVIDFGGLFSGNAIGPARSAQARLEFNF